MSDSFTSGGNEIPMRRHSSIKKLTLSILPWLCVSTALIYSAGCAILNKWSDTPHTHNRWSAIYWMHIAQASQSVHIFSQVLTEIIFSQPCMNFDFILSRTSFCFFPMALRNITSGLVNPGKFPKLSNITCSWYTVTPYVSPNIPPSPEHQNDLFLSCLRLIYVGNIFERDRRYKAFIAMRSSNLSGFNSLRYFCMPGLFQTEMFPLVSHADIIQMFWHHQWQFIDINFHLMILPDQIQCGF